MSLCLVFPVLLLLLVHETVGTTQLYVTTSEAQTCPPNNICQTLFHYTQNSKEYFTSGTTFIFLPGMHSLNTTLVVKDISNLTLTTSSNSASIYCTPSSNVGIAFVNVSTLYINGLEITSCGREMTPTLFNKTVSEYATTFLNFSVSIYAAVFFNYITESLALNNVRIHDNQGYGMMGVNLYGDTLISNSQFISNNNITFSMPSCYEDPSLLCKGGNLVLVYTDFKNCPNTVVQYSLTLENSVFQGGVDFGFTYQAFFRPTYVIMRNDVLLLGGAGVGLMMMQSSYGLTVAITNCTIYHNSGYTGANLYMVVWDFVDNSSVTIKDTNITHGNTLDLFNKLLQHTGNYDLATGYFYMYGMIPFGDYTPVCTPEQKYQVEVLRIENCQVSHNVASLNSAGFMYMWPRSFLTHPRHISLSGVTFEDNNGDATVINFYVSDVKYGHLYNVTVSNTTFRGNFYSRNRTRRFESSNPQVYLINSVQNFIFRDCKWIENKASGIRSLASLVYLDGANTFIDNTATGGAAANIREGSILTFLPSSVTTFQNNKAQQYGGAIYAEMYNYLCFFKIDPLAPLPLLSFINNTAGEAGDAVYANLENCLISQNVYTSQSLQIFAQISDFSNTENSTSLISSEASQVCVCLDGVSQCNSTVLYKQVHIGELFSVSVEARGYNARDLTSLYGAGLTPTDLTATIIGNISEVRLGNLQTTQAINKGCSNVMYKLLSSEPQVIQMSLSPRNERIFVPALVQVDLQPCPVGFAISDLMTCDCIPILRDHVTCHSESLTVSYTVGHWVGIISNTTPATGPCDFYCAASMIPNFKLEDPDLQCIDNHSGLLCGKCKEGYSVVLGSYKCLKCSNAYLALLIYFAVAGILLIVFLSLLRVTVNTGRINSFLFFANVIKLVNLEFFQLSDKGFALFQVIISWINLDFGIESCFYDGLDTYAKAWLQFAFSFYLFVLLTVPVIAAKHSSKIAELLPSNTVAVMATVCLISFTKLLRASTFVFPFTMITTTNAEFSVWKYDGNVYLFSVRYIPLFLFSLSMFLLLVLPYALIMFFYPFIWSFSSHEGTKFERFVNFIRDRLFKLKPLLETYDGPFLPKHRYWSGLLVVLRMVIYFIAFALSTSSNQNVFNSAMVTVISLVLIGLLLALKLYQCPINRRVEFCNLLNLAVLQFVLMVLNLTNQSEHAQGIAISISIAIAVFIFIYSIGYEMFYFYRPKYYKWRGISFVDAHKAKCVENAQIRDREQDKQNYKLDSQAKDDNEFFDVVDARKSVPRSSVSYISKVNLTQPLNS